jgi:hypothetical protein
MGRIEIFVVRREGFEITMAAQSALEESKELEVTKSQERETRIPLVLDTTGYHWLVLIVCLQSVPIKAH